VLPNNHYQICQSPLGNFHVSNDTDDTIYIRHDTHQYYQGGNIDSPSEEASFLRSVSHEFFHAIQRSYGITSHDPAVRKGVWIIEGTARFIPTVINPSESFFPNQNENSRSLYIYDAVDYLKNPSKGLDTGRSLSETYDVSIFWRYIFEHAGRIGIIEKIFDQIKTENPKGFAAEINSISNALQTLTKNIFIDFAKSNYLEFSNNKFTRDDEFYENSKAYYENVATVGDKIFVYDGEIIPIALKEPVGSFATSYIEFVALQGDPVYVVFSGSTDTEWNTSLVLYTSGGVQIESFDRSILIISPDRYEKIAVVVTNLGLASGTYDLKLSEKPVVVDVVLDTDRSGSMSGSPMTAAKNAAKAFVDLLQKPIDSMPMDKVGLVSFASSATLDLGLTTNFVLAKQKIDGYYASGNTNMGDALSKSINEIKTNGRVEAIKAILFFTDGYTNVGPSKSEIINTLIPQAKGLGIKIYTLGFGSADTSFLQEIASKTDGKYFYAPSADKLKSIYEEISQALKGWIRILGFTGVVAQGETAVAGNVGITFGVGSFKVILSWGGSNLDLVLVDPNGVVVQPGTGGVFYSGDTKPEYYEILNPAPGNWTVKVYGKEAVGSVSYDVSVFQPVPILDVKPTKWDIDYKVNNSQVFTVSELGGYSSLVGVTFIASDLKSFDVAAEHAYMLQLAEAELAGESFEFAELEQGNVTIIPGSSFSFAPNNFEVTAGSSKYVLAVLNVPPGIPNGNYSGSITVSSNAGNSTVIVTLDYVRPKTAPYELKSEALGKLRNMSSSNCDSWFWWFTKDCRNEHRINNAISYLEQSLSPEYWGDVNTLDPSLGEEVFDFEKDAVEELMAIEE